MSSEATASMIAQRLTAALAPSHLDVADQSALHAGHAGSRAGGGHYSVTVVSESFEGVGLRERHRMVYAALADLMTREIHALALRTLAPSEFVSPG